MAFTLAKASARSNSHRPSARPRPTTNPVPELVRGVAMQHPGREARGLAIPLRGGAIRREASDLGVDLRALQLPREVHVDDLGFRVEVVDLPPALPVAVPGLFHAPTIGAEAHQPF